MRTPLLTDSTGQRLLKLESHQPGGSYKIRGVTRFLDELPPSSTTVRAFSAGNMARTLAMLGAERSLIVRASVPDTIPAAKREALRQLGVEIDFLPMEELWGLVEEPERGRKDGEALLHPVDSPALLRGYTQLIDELLAECPDFDELVVPFGVGGLTLALAYRLKTLRPQVRFISAEVSSTAPLSAAIEGKTGRLPREKNWIDAIGTPRVLPRVLQALRTGVVPGLGVAPAPLIDEVRTVTPAVALHAARKLYAETGERLEGAAAVALAAVHGESCAVKLFPGGRVPSPGTMSPAVAVLTGGNVDRVVLEGVA